VCNIARYLSSFFVYRAKKQEFEQKWLELIKTFTKNSIDVLTPQWQEQKLNQQLKTPIADYQVKVTELLKTVLMHSG